MDSIPWFERAFGAEYCDVYPHRDLGAAKAEIRFLAESGLPTRGARVLDLACGFGRHTQALVDEGFCATGVDLSPELLALAPGEPGGRYLRADMRELPFQKACFEACVCLFSSFGYLRSDAEHLALLRGLAAVLGPGAALFLDLMNPHRIRTTLVPETVTELKGMRIVQRRTLAEGGEAGAERGADRACRRFFKMLDRGCPPV